MADPYMTYLSQAQKAYDDYMKATGGQATVPGTSGNVPGQNPYTPPKALYEGVAGSLQSALKGELPQDVVNQLQQRAAEFGVASGLPGSQFAGYQGLRNLGLTSLDRIRDAEKAISQTWMTPEQQAANSLRTMQQNYSNQASQLQLDQARQNQIMNNIAAANKAWAQSTGQWNTGTRTIY